MELSTEHTVVALAGSTGGGKSSLFNAVSGLDIARVGIRRPTTAQPLACVWGTQGAEPLLDWLGIPALNRISRESVLDPDAKDIFDGLVLLDLPDHDSTEAEHRKTVDRMVELVDLFVWVMDPQKYADASLHERYLRPLAEHRDVIVVVLNQIDRLASDDVEACVSDLRRLLDDDGLAGAPILPLSAVTSDGLDALVDLLRRTVAEQRASAERVDADVRRVARRMVEASGTAEAGEIGEADRDRLVETLTDAADIDTVAEEAGRVHLRPARRVQQPQVRVDRDSVVSAVRDMGRVAAGSLSRGWGGSIRSVADDAAETVPGELETALSSVDLAGGRGGAWWRLSGLVEWLALITGVVGGLWALVLEVETRFEVEWLDRQDVPEPAVAGSSLPMVLLVAGGAIGLILAAGRAVAARRARRSHAVDVRRRLRAAVEEVVDDAALAPLRDELSLHDTFRRALIEASS